ncbi:MAG: polysaccharide biosynthesis protein [Clostridiales bacterium]|nr:polysaccharide biosynthesis protein [Clostridiales bacterium]
MSKGKLLKGTAILTIVGVITRLLGFFYRIFLSNLLGAEKLGVYQLIFPVYGICYNIYATGIQTTISRFVASELGKKNYKNTVKVLRIGLFLSVSLASILSLIIYFNASFIATNIIFEPRITSSLKILAVVFPFCGITSCINGYYYGLTKSGVPAITQLLEQLVRVFIVYAIASVLANNNYNFTIEIAVIGLVIGEISSTIYNIISYYSTYDTKQIKINAKRTGIRARRTKPLLESILKMSLPLTSNRLIISILTSVEAILIPSLLRKYGLEHADALSIYGILNAMAKPFIMFPSTVTNSLSVLLLPTISEAAATKNLNSIRRTTSLSIKYSLLVGILSSGIFIVFGEELGLRIFSNNIAGRYITILAWLCPFLYIGSTFTSILNGLDKVYLSFLSSVAGLTVKILLIMYLIPRSGITGYFISFLLSLLLTSCFEFYVIYKDIRPKLDALEVIVIPTIIVLVSGYLIKAIHSYLSVSHGGILLLFILCLAYASLYLILLYIGRVIKKEELK